MSKKMSFNKPCKYVESHCEKIKAELAEAKAEVEAMKGLEERCERAIVKGWDATRVAGILDALAELDRVREALKGLEGD